MAFIEGFILTPEGFARGRLDYAEGRILGVSGVGVTEEEARQSGPGPDLPLVLPGFIDLHVHGGGGRDTMEGGDAIVQIARLHARHGTTALLATTMTAPLDEIRVAIAALGPAVAQRPAGSARVLGVHLEGPYINPAKLALLLEVPVGQAVLFITRVGFVDSGQAIELTHSYCRSDYYDFVAEMKREG